MERSETTPASSTFLQFLKPGLDRCAFISAWLHAREIPHSIVEMAARKHLVVRFATDSYDPTFRMKTLIAHYDRAENTPGANDNSAACFQLMLLAERLTTASAVHNIRIIFTDGEEAAGKSGISGQGAFALGTALKKLKLTEDDVYVFDACGRGDTLVLSTAGISTNLPAAARKSTLAARLTALHENACSLALEVSGESWIRLATPYSDNAGLLAAGIAAQVITVLPHEEAGILLGALGGPGAKKILETLVRNRALETGSPQTAVIPETWKLMHTDRDTASSLSAQAFALMARFLDACARRLEIA